MVWNKAEDAGGLSPAKDNNAVFTAELVSFYSPIALRDDGTIRLGPALSSSVFVALPAEMKAVCVLAALERGRKMAYSELLCSVNLPVILRSRPV